MGRTGLGVLLLAAAFAGCTAPNDRTANLEDIDTLGNTVETPPRVVSETPPERTLDEEGEAVHPTPEDEDGGAPPDWTTAAIEAPSTAQAPPVVLESVRPGRHTEFDRVVFDLGGGEGVPGYQVRYVDRPLHECGSGRQIQPAGQGWLELRMEPAAAHTEAGRATVPRGPTDPEMPQILRIYRTCDFEGVVTFVMAVRTPEPFRAFHLNEPRRIVVDVRHRSAP